ncbi:MAG: hypothetical protein JSS43_16730 [Proteobacteria bacterium]|nr:hypothetical protein [Pseudomonadota bacterium]
MPAFPPNISHTVVYTILDLLLPLFLRYAGTRNEAGLVVLDLLIEQKPQTNEELGLIGEVIGFRYKALGLIRDSEHPDLPIATVLQLTKTANALRRNEAAAQRKLDALRRARLAEQEAAPAAEADPPPPEPVQPPQAGDPAGAPPAAAAAAPARTTGIHARLQTMVGQLTNPGDPAHAADISDGFAALRHDLLGATPHASNSIARPTLQPH